MDSAGAALKLIALLRSFGFVWALLLVVTSLSWAQSDADIANQYYRYSSPALEAVCARMSPTSHPSGLTDGAWLAPAFAGRTYYYQSACYLELARRTADASWCAKVRERKTLLGDGSSHTPASCQRMVAALQQSQASMQQSADRHAAAVRGVFKITSAKATALANGDWVLVVQTEGALAGRYRLQVDNSRDRIRLVTQELMLPQPGPQRYTLARQHVLGSTPLPNIFPIAVSLTYLFPAAAADANPAQTQEHLSSIEYLTLSAQ